MAYLTDHYQFVNVKGDFSMQTKVKFGVPQDTILGQFLLFFCTFSLAIVIPRYAICFPRVMSQQVLIRDTRLIKLIHL